MSLQESSNLTTVGLENAHTAEAQDKDFSAVFFEYISGP